MPRGAPALKLAITVDRDVHAQVIRAAAEDKLSVSAWLTAAARRAIKVREGLAAVAEWEAEQGELSAEELASARKRIEGRTPSRMPPRRTARRARSA